MEFSSLVIMHKLTAALLFCVLNQISARCLLGVCTDKCEDNAPPAGTCAILFDEPKCNEDQFSVPINQGLTIRSVPVTGVSFNFYPSFNFSFHLGNFFRA